MQKTQIQSYRPYLEDKTWEPSSHSELENLEAFRSDSDI